MLWSFMPNHLAQVAHVDLLPASWANVTVIMLVGIVTVVPLARNGWPKI